MAWAWEAGPQCGIAGTRRQARRHVTAALRSGTAATAELQQVVVDTGSSSLEGRYVPLSGTRLLGRRRGAGIQWAAGDGA